MQLLLCAATRNEIEPTIRHIESQQLQNIDVVITGVGITAATYAITKAIYEKKPGLVLQAGVAGSLDPALTLGSTFLVEHETIGDLGVEENGAFKTISDLNLLDQNEFPWKDGKLSNNLLPWKHLALRELTGITVNEISTNEERINYYRNNLGAELESLEGASLHYVALMENIPFLQLRALSNFVGERNKSKWMMQAAIADLNQELQRVISKLNNNEI
jgi:futalosine hydrolase